MIRQTAIFDRLGLAGLMYWYGIYPLHQLVFAGMLRNLARAAEKMSLRDEATEHVTRERLSAFRARGCSHS